MYEAWLDILGPEDNVIYSRFAKQGDAWVFAGRREVSEGPRAVVLTVDGLLAEIFVDDQTVAVGKHIWI